MSDIKITVVGIEKIQAALAKFPREIQKNMAQAGQEAGTDLLKLEGLQEYPPGGPWNSPPPPYYKRGTGTIGVNRTYKTSKNLGKQWTIKKQEMNTVIGNSAPYAPYLHGEEDTRVYWATSHGWLPLLTTAKRYIHEITATYQAWVNKTIRDLGL